MVLATAIMVATALPALAVPAIDSVVTQHVDFSKPDGEATGVARQMYGKQYASVLAVRVWLRKKTDGYDQMLVRLGKDRNCTGGCQVAALYYDGKQWLEVWRRPGRRVGLGPVGPAGMKPLWDGKHLWRWYGKNYVEAVNDEDMKPRKPTEKELKVTVAALDKAFGKTTKLEDPANVSAVDLNIKDGKGTAMLVSSIAYCGNSACPVIILDGDKKVLATLYSLGPDVATVARKDNQGRHLVEVAIPGGTALYSVSTGQAVSQTRPMEITIAGDKR